MQRRKNVHQTRRHRLIEHDYSEPGFYFVTFGTRDGLSLLGTIENQSMQLSPTGLLVEDILHELPSEYEQLELDSYTIMPNHVHLLLYLRIDMEPVSISQIVRKVKGRSATGHRNLTQNRGGLWQKGFHDEIVRDDTHLYAVRRYISENPLKWKNEDIWF